jgi:exopolysaccharide/PEP-CTERM locus tyrosine autokinase
VGTIAKALQKRKTEIEGLTKAKPEPTPGPRLEAPAQPAKLSENLKRTSGRGFGAPAAVVHVSLATDQAKRSGSDADLPVAPTGSEASGVASAVGRHEAVAPAVADPTPAEVKHPSSSTEKMRIDPSLVSLVDPDGFEADLFRLLRTRILFPQAGPPPRTILVTSAQAEEGKSFVAANLAINIARSVDQHVLLVDCDLRKPTIHTKFGFNGVKGLSEYLSAGLDLAALLLKSGVEKLTLLPSGAAPQNPSELITSSRMAALIQELKARYHDRYIIFDSPPPIMAPETSAIAKWVDGILLIVKYGVTPMDLVEELMTHLDREKIIGAVINKFNAREFRRYSYNKYYGYSYKSYSKDGGPPLA